MRTTRRAFAISLCVAAAFLAASCNNDYAVYQNVAKEQKQNGQAIFQETICKNAFRLNSDYYAATSKLYCSPIHLSTDTTANDIAWTLVPINCLGNLSSSYTLRAAVVVGGTIYALTGNDSSSVALSSSTDGSTWTSITTPSPPRQLSSNLASNIPSSFAFDALYSAGGHLYAEANLYDTSSGGAVGTPYYYLYFYTGTGWEQVSNFQNINNSPIRGVVANSDTSPTNFYFASEGQLYSGSLMDGSNASSIINNFSSLSTHEIWAISYTGGHFYVSTPDGNLYQDSGNPYQVDSASRPLTKVISVPYSSPSSIILVGTDTNNVNTAACGYYEGTFGSLALGSSSQDISSSAVYSTTVSVFPVQNFFYDGSASSGNLFVCIAPGYLSTSYYGLYEVSWNGTSWSNGWEAQ
jgi:hypothetical protein